MGRGSSQLVRDVVARDYLARAKRAHTPVIVEVGSLQEKLLRQGFPPSHIRQICEAMKSKILQREQGVSVRVLGEDYRVSTRYEYRFTAAESQEKGKTMDPSKDPLLALRGILKGAFPEGVEAFLADLRRDREEQE